ncbi:hypothetical protein L3X38_033342 [Prunus dulcis]|uniref:Uncharacterized protein n=1 Tax=Prunus dulcis TaxID=3755 RepID=A0AAD4VFQ2_PRUDU|nr:hypothetical protein L3X38_033342 [Prunus dulcis]
MASDDIDNFLAHLSRKRARDEEENKKKMTTITCIIAIVGAWYNENYLVKEPSHDWDEERRCRLNRLYNGKEVDCIEQLRPCDIGGSERDKWKWFEVILY